MALPVVQANQTFTGSTTFNGSDWTITFSNIVVGSFAETMLVFTMTSDGFDNPTQVFWGSQAFTLMENPAGGVFSTIGYLTPAAAATQNIVVHSTHAGGINNIRFTAIVISGAPVIGASAGGYSFGSSVSASITTTEADSLVLGFGADIENSTQTIGSGQTLIASITTAPSAYTSYKTEATKGTSVSMSTSSSGGSSDISMFVLEIVSAVPSSPSNFFLVL